MSSPVPQSTPPTEPQRRALRTPAALLRAALYALPVLLTACGQAEPSTEDAAPTPTPTPGVLAEQKIGDLIAAFTPPEATANSSVQDDWIRRRRAVIARMKRGDDQLGELLIQAFRTRDELIVPVRSGLLEAAAYANPAAATPVLVELVTTYGDDIGLRTDACRYLAAAAPEKAIETLDGILFETDRASTGPSDEALLDGWLEAHRALDREPGRKLADIATDIGRDEPTRHLAIRALGTYPSKLSESALEEVLHESSGNSYMRRLAAQSLIDISEREVYCPILTQVFQHESDVNFQLYLENTIETYCQ